MVAPKRAAKNGRFEDGLSFARILPILPVRFGDARTKGNPE